MKTKLKKWKKVSSRRLFKNKYFELYKDVVKFTDGRLYDYFVNNPKGRAALVLPFDNNGRVLVSREYRYPVRSIILNSVGGSVEKGETPIQAAKRELKEETGYQARSWKFIGKIYGNPSRSGTIFFLYKATNLVAGRKRPDSTENVENVWLPVRRFERMITSGGIMEPYLLAMYLKVLLTDGHYGLN